MNAFSNYATNNTGKFNGSVTATTEYTKNKSFVPTTGNYIQYTQPMDIAGNYIQYTKPMAITAPNTQTPVQNDNWTILPFNEDFRCTLYVKQAMYNLATTTNFLYSLKDIHSVMTLYANRYNANINGYLTGYTDNKNFQIKASCRGQIPFNLIIYVENGLLNVVASYNK